ncbi:MAG: hypothetical protein ACPIOQ_62175, partial [Promethearchaeia archaeon]
VCVCLSVCLSVCLCTHLYMQETDRGHGRARVAVCVSGAMRGFRADVLEETLLSKLERFDVFVYTTDDGTQKRLR